MGQPRRWLDHTPLERRQIEHEAVVAGAEASDVVATAADRQGKLPRAGEGDAGLDIGHLLTAQDEGGMLVEQAVPDPAGLVVGGVTWRDDGALHLAAQRGPGCFGNPRGLHGGHGSPSVSLGHPQ